MSTGRIFPQSANIFQDQAKILFDFYKQSAVKIVDEEVRIEGEIEILEKKIEGFKKDFEKANLFKWLFCIFIIPYFYFSHKQKNITALISQSEDRVKEFWKMHKEIFRDYQVSKLGVVYVPMATQVTYEDKSFIVDHTGMVNQSEVKLQISRQNDLLIRKIGDLERLVEKAPIIESSNHSEKIDTSDYSRSLQEITQYDYFGDLNQTLKTIKNCLGDLDVTSVSLPLVNANSNYLKFLNEYATFELPENAQIIKVFDDKIFVEDINKFKELNKLRDSLSRHTEQFEDVLKNLMSSMAQSIQAVSALKIASTDKIVFESNKILYKILKAPYNHYSPILEAAEIERIKNENFNYGEDVMEYIPFQLKESSRVRYNILSDVWTAEDGSTTNFPFGIHQIHEEIVAPMVQNLMQENRLERLKIYNHIKDQKISYLNKWHQDTEDFYGRNRAESSDLINLMRSSLRDYISAYSTLDALMRTEKSMQTSSGSLDSTIVQKSNNNAEVLLAFETQSKEFQSVQNDFEMYMERLKEDIELKAEKFEHIDFYDALLRDGLAKDNAVAAAEMSSLEERRKPLIAVNPLFAKVSEMPPEVELEPAVFEHFSLNLPALAKNALDQLIKEVESNEETSSYGISGKSNGNAFAEDSSNLTVKNEGHSPEIENSAADINNNAAKNDNIVRDSGEHDDIEDDDLDNDKLEDDQSDEQFDKMSETEKNSGENKFCVDLVDIGPSPDKLLFALVEITGFEEEEALELLSSDNQTLLLLDSYDEASKYKMRLEAAGAKIKLRKIK